MVVHNEGWSAHPLLFVYCCSMFELCVVVVSLYQLGALWIPVTQTCGGGCWTSVMSLPPQTSTQSPAPSLWWRSTAVCSWVTSIQSLLYNIYSYCY